MNATGALTVVDTPWTTHPLKMTSVPDFVS